MAFDILEHRYPGSVEGRRWSICSPGPACSGIEALSRGARFALFVDNGKAEAGALLLADVETLGLQG